MVFVRVGCNSRKSPPWVESQCLSEEETCHQICHFRTIDTLSCWYFFSVLLPVLLWLLQLKHWVLLKMPNSISAYFIQTLKSYIVRYILKRITHTKLNWSTFENLILNLLNPTLDMVHKETRLAIDGQKTIKSNETLPYPCWIHLVCMWYILLTHVKNFQDA